MKAASSSLPVSEKRYLTMAEAVAYLGLPSENALRHRMKRGTVPSWCYTHLGRSLRFIRASLDELLQPNRDERCAVQRADLSRGRRLSVVRSHRRHDTDEPSSPSSQNVGEQR